MHCMLANLKFPKLGSNTPFCCFSCVTTNSHRTSQSFFTCVLLILLRKAKAEEDTSTIKVGASSGVVKSILPKDFQSRGFD